VDGAPLVDEPIADAAAHLRRLVSHVAAEADAKLGGFFLPEPGENAREGPADEISGLAVEFGPVEATDVIGLEDARRDRGQNLPSRLS